MEGSVGMRSIWDPTDHSQFFGTLCCSSTSIDRFGDFKIVKGSIVEG